MAAGLIDIFAEEFEHLIKEFQLPLQNQILTFSLLLFIILLSPIILRKVKIPALIGLIIAGVIIGPHGFNMISETNMKEGFMGMFSKIGLLYIMFMAGLELDMHEFKRHRNRSIAFGVFTFIIPLALGYPLCKHVLGLNDMASLLTASMFSTHTLVAYPIVTKYGISKIQSVAIAIGGTILTDTAVLIILSVISGSDGGNINTNVLLQLLITLSIFSLIMFWVIPKLSRWFFSKLESEKSSQYIYVLSVLFFAAFLAEAAGIEAIIGAFVAGLVLNRLIPHSSTLMNRIEFIGSALFIPFFLIYIGMVVNLTKLAGDWWAWAIAGILTGFALISKFLAAWATQLVFRMKSVDRRIIFGLSSAHAAATLAIIKVGFDKEILDISIVNGTVILILITSLAASFVTESASKKMLVEQAKNEPMEGPLRRSQHLLVAANELQGNEQLLDFSILITDKKVVNPISVVSVLENDQDVENRIRKSRKYIDEFVNYFSSSEMSIQATATIDHNVSNGIGRVAKEVAADIVLINDQSKTNLLKRLIGDDRDHLLDACEKTVFFCHFERPFASYRTIALICPPLAEVESSFGQWLERVFRLAKELNCSIEIYSTTETKEKIQEYQNFRKFGSTTRHFLIEHPEDSLQSIATYKDQTLVVGVMARSGGISAFLGQDLFAGRIEKEAPHLDRILIYPSQLMAESVFGSYDDVSAIPLSVGVETIQRLSKEVGGIFKKGESDENRSSGE